MCGIAATYNGTMEDTLRMGEAIKQRGTQTSVHECGNLKVFFTWLPITDPTAPIQPFKAGEYTVWLVGYISNYHELSERYSIQMETACDTELLAKFINIFGYTKLNELNGMFAVLIDHAGEVKFFTDRYGIKQLYLYTEGATTFIASEIKAIQAVRKLRLSESGIADWEYSLGVMNDGTIYQGVTRVPKLPFHKPAKIKLDYDNAKEILKGLLTQSFRRNRTIMKSGVFLSGGVDSGLIARYMNPDYSFSVDYIERDYSEIENIKLNSQGNHYTIISNQDTYNNFASKAIEALDDPKVGACYNNFALTELASKFCTVLYSGAGGDEVFSGYTHRYNRPIADVIRRSDFKHNFKFNYPKITHKEYDWKYLSGILTVEDRISGHFTMETRYPLLDNDLVDFALSLPDEYLYNKRIIKDICDLPKEVVEGKKRGFCNPVSNNTWIKDVLYAKQRRFVQPLQPV